MSKKALIEKEKKRLKLVLRYEERRKELKKTIASPNSSDEERDQAVEALHDFPKNSARIRLRNRCQLTGRPRAYYRKFGLSRLCFRELARSGMIPGIYKASW